MKNTIQGATRYTDVPCPFCSLLCDDLVITNDHGTITTEKNACSKASKQFHRKPTKDVPKINGKPATLDEATRFAAAILKKTQQPLFAGLGTDVHGMRAVMDIAEQTRGIVDHMHGEQATYNFRVLQDRGWMNTTLTEVRNRADLIILAGTDTSAFPRFFERLILNQDPLFIKQRENRQIIYLGDGEGAAKLKKPNGRKISQLRFKTSRLGEVLSSLRAIIAGVNLQASKIAGIKIKELEKLAEKMQSANYGVIVWSPADLKWQHADLTVQAICGLVEDMNRTTRFAGLPLGGNEGGMSAAAVCTWQSGYPLHVSYGRNYPEYDLQYSMNKLLHNNEVDALIWISSISTDIQPPKTGVPIIALTTPNMTYKQVPAVHIPVGTPGIDHAGQMIRCDNVVSQRLQKITSSGLPDLRSVLGQIQKAL